MSAKDYRPIGGKDFNKTVNQMTLRRIVEFSKLNLASADTLIVFTIPAGFVFESRVVIPRILEGSAATIELGPTGTLSGLITAGSTNGTVNVALSTAQSIAAGRWFTANTDLILTANATCAVAKLEIILRGFMLPV